MRQSAERISIGNAASLRAAAFVFSAAVALTPVAGCAQRAGGAAAGGGEPSAGSPPRGREPGAPVNATAPASEGAASGAAGRLARGRAAVALQERLAATFATPELANTSWGITVRSLRTGETLFEHNPTKLMVPASSMKVVTLAAAAERLGWDYRYETRLGTAAPVEDGIVRGDVVVRGNGDPSIMRGEGSWSSAFDAIAEQLKSGGITRIEGRLIGDDNAFEDRGYGVNWAWDDFSYDYSAPIGALQYHENVVELRITAGRPGELARVDVVDPNAGLTVVTEAITAAAGAPSSLDFDRLPNQPGVRVIGQLAADAKPVTGLVSVDNPTLYFARALRAALIGHGIEVAGDAADIDDIPGTSLSPSNGATTTPVTSNVPHTLAAYRSPRLQEIGTRLMKVSQNLIAETFLKQLSVTAPASAPVASAAAGRDVLREMITKDWGVDPNQFVIWDGSGLSRRDYLSATLLASALTRMAQNPAHKDAFASTLPVGGRDGGLEHRMKGTPAEGNVRAKTGSMSQVRSLAGYVSTAEGEELVFAFIANGFTAPSSRVDATVDAALDLLARFSR